MAKVVKPPHSEGDLKVPSVFLAGSIEMGSAPDWQKWVATVFQNRDIVLFNPRRDHWDTSWKQDISNPHFRQQVEWELEHLERADAVLFYFSPETKSPITLLELGLLAAQAPEKCVVCCPPGFWRRGNVQVLCDRYNLTLTDSLVDAVRVVSENLR